MATPVAGSAVVLTKGTLGAPSDIAVQRLATEATAAVMSVVTSSVRRAGEGPVTRGDGDVCRRSKGGGAVIIDCDGCRVRDVACGDCVVTVLLDMSGGVSAPDTVELDEAEAHAIAVLAGSGLVPPLRLVPGSGWAREAGVSGEREPAAYDVRHGRGGTRAG
jgi:hypothetical protein